MITTSVLFVNQTILNCINVVLINQEVVKPPSFVACTRINSCTEETELLFFRVHVAVCVNEASFEKIIEA